MATIKINTNPPEPPPVESVTVTFSEDEYQHLYDAICALVPDGKARALGLPTLELPFKDGTLTRRYHGGRRF